MTEESHNDHKPSTDDFTIPSRATIARKPRGLGEVAHQLPSTAVLKQVAGMPSPTTPPILLRHFLDGTINLDKELTQRFLNLPLLSVMRVQTYNGRTSTASVTISAQDGSSALHVDVDPVSRDAYFTFVLGGMIGLRFVISQLSDMDRSHWLEPMRRENGEVSFLWNQARWENDYLICASHRHYTNLFAFSKTHVEAAARLTNEVSTKFLDWLDAMWREDAPNKNFKVW